MLQIIFGSFSQNAVPERKLIGNIYLSIKLSSRCVCDKEKMNKFIPGSSSSSLSNI